jgi:hypothetical protein
MAHSMFRFTVELVGDWRRVFSATFLVIFPVDSNWKSGKVP